MARAQAKFEYNLGFVFAFCVHFVSYGHGPNKYSMQYIRDLHARQASFNNHFIRLQGISKPFWLKRAKAKQGNKILKE